MNLERDTFISLAKYNFFSSFGYVDFYVLKETSLDLYSC